jgi:biotin operon repressor
MGEVQRADIAEQRSIESMQFSLADAQRKERMGDVRGAQASAESARKLQADVNRAKLNKAQALSNLDAKAMQALRTTGKGAGSGPKIAEQLGAAEIAYAQNPTKENLTVVKALRATQDRLAFKQTSSVSDIPVGGPKDTNAAEVIAGKASEALSKYKTMNGRDWKKAVEAAGSVEAAEAKFKKNYLTVNPQAAEAAPVPRPSAAPKPAAAATTGKAISKADVEATVKASGRTRQEVMDALKAKGYTVQ